MSEHYYSEKPTVCSDRHVIEATLRGKTYKFTTDAGVFSKKGVDFGSKLLIESMEFEDNARVLDVGCGYGPIGLSAATIAVNGFVTMIDMNQRALELVRMNAAANGIMNVKVLQSDALAAVKQEQFDVVLTNPPIRAGKETVHRIFTEAREALVPGGTLWVVIQKKQGSPSAYAKLEELFERVEEVTKDKGYRIFKAEK
ncbi:class I SAM-dependent methyltransferase [Paenibacillus albiflavus]|uniref:Class I SAM-dependent methyltransferase n=1 Tax=Paenibacillus albiflavus TaxID=2545760 RepID=A0A4V2WMB2_9BACL|nr:class I SAM-dependent methyltransferase [Paenibacillus albiflavus]TCZ67533.1 class I SAM-dependent methyltransferase [Paenibacillus albiflavus]